jgi:hypothetical protein
VVRGCAILMAMMAAAAVLAGCGDDNTTGSEETLTFTEVDKGSHFATIGNATGGGQPSPGTGYSLAIPLQDSSKNTVGELNAICIATQPGKTLTGTCSGTADVPGGQLALSVGGGIEDNVSGAIVGGTGKYEGATGSFTSRASEDTFNITLP